jgi:hypothetical protein
MENVPTASPWSLDEDDVAAFPGLQLTPSPATIGDLFLPAIVNGSTLLPDNFSYFNHAKNTAVLDLGEDVKDAIRVIDVPLPLFWQVAPSINDLQYTAHVRKVSLGNKLTMPATTAKAEAGGPFSMVSSNRLPQDSKKSKPFWWRWKNLKDI